MKSLAALATAGMLLMPFSAAAMSGADYMDKMTPDVRAGFLAGAIGMAMFDSASDARVKCIDDWYFGQNSTAPAEIASVMDQYRTKPAAGLLKVLIDRKCGK